MARTHQTAASTAATARPLAEGASVPVAPVPLPALAGVDAAGRQTAPRGRARTPGTGAALRREVDPGQIRRLSVGGKRVREDKPFVSSKIPTIIDHMKGEWDGGNQGSVGGGHLLSSMIDTWAGGDATKVFTTDPTTSSPHGIYFERRIPNHKRIIENTLFTFRLVGPKKAKPQETAVSGPKPSTFWPVDWTATDLAATFANSHQYGDAADRFVSSANTSYHYLWQTLGDNTAFPVGPAGAVTDSDNIRGKNGTKAALAYASRGTSTES